MKKERLSVSSVFCLMGAGAGITVLGLCGGIFFFTKSITGVLACLLTAAVLFVWAAALVTFLQKRLALFTNEICRIIDNMMESGTAPKAIFDEDTMLDRIGHQLTRLYQMLQADKNALELQKANLQGLISDVSHQVKTPVTNLKMASSALMERELLRTRQEEYLNTIHVQVNKLDFLMGALIKSSRLETGVIALQKQTASLYETLAAALGGIFIRAEEKQLRVTVECPENLLVSHDPKWTGEALFNILDNAVKYTPAKGSIRVTAVRWEAYTKIEITDTGRGIAESRQAAIFKRFYREPELYGTEGIGIGLYLTREIISRQGGYVTVVSSPGKGAAFCVFLPNE